MVLNAFTQRGVAFKLLPAVTARMEYIYVVG